MTVVEAARHLKVSRQTMHRLLAEKAAITPEMAVRLGKFCGNGPGLWLRMQQAYDLWRVEHELRELIREIPTFKTAA
jgi:addiction module HigA family antidote